MTATDEQSDEIAALRAALAALLGATEAAFDGAVTLRQLDDMAAGGNRLAAAMAQGRRAAVGGTKGGSTCPDTQTKSR